MTAEEAIAYIENYTWSATRLGLERTRELLLRLGQPQRRLKFVHVAGSNGKGSTCAMLDGVLRAAGYKTGLYTSPYIEDFRERMKIDGEMISGGELAELTGRVRLAADDMADHPSQFELVTAIAMLYFAEAKCDIVVLEVGMGGELDSTNAIDAPEAAVITNIGLEHTEYLGRTLGEIASAKAGIIKPGSAAVLYDGAPEVTAVVERACAERGVPLTRADFSEITPLGHSLDGQLFRWRGLELSLPLLGAHQLRNAATALEAICVLRGRGWSLSDEAIKTGLASVKWPARFEVLSREPLFILDGGHNPQCAGALADILTDYLPGKSFTLLMGVLADKDYGAMTDAVAPFAESFVCVTPDSPRALAGDALAEYLTGRGLPAAACKTVDDGISEALGKGLPVVAFGSLYMAGAVRRGFRPAFKKWLRQEKIRARDALSPAQRAEKSARIAARIAASPEFRAAKTVLLYRAVRGEVSLDGLEETAKASGKRLAYPLCVSRTEMEARLPEGGDGWRPGAFGIPEPAPERSRLISPEDMDLVICPCTAFDEGKNRLGMGGGYYDRYLPRCPGARVIAAAFEAQKAPPLPAEPWDSPMDAVFTEDREYGSEE